MQSSATTELQSHPTNKNLYFNALYTYLNYVTNVIMICIDYLPVEYCSTCNKVFPRRFRCIYCLPETLLTGQIIGSNLTILDSKSIASLHYDGYLHYIPFGHFDVWNVHGLWRIEFNHCVDKLFANYIMFLPQVKPEIMRNGIITLSRGFFNRVEKDKMPSKPFYNYGDDENRGKYVFRFPFGETYRQISSKHYGELFTLFVLSD